MTLEQGEERATWRGVLLVGEERLAAAGKVIREQLANVTAPERLERMLGSALKSASWEEILNTS